MRISLLLHRSEQYTNSITGPDSHPQLCSTFSATRSEVDAKTVERRRLILAETLAAYPDRRFPDPYIVAGANADVS